MRAAGAIVTATLLLALFLVARRSPPSAPVETPSRGGQLVASIREAPQSFNPLVRRNDTSEVLTRLTGGTLVRIDPATQELQPWLAESWEASEDGRVYRLRLRPGVTWSDGTPFTSGDVEFSARAAFSPAADGDVATRMTVARQAPRITAADPSTVVVTFPMPSGPGVRLLDALPMLPKHKLEAALVGGTLTAAWDLGSNLSDIVSIGPFVIREYQAGREIVLERNQQYWRRAPDGGALPYLDRLVLQVMPPASALAAVTSGRLDLPSDPLTLEESVLAASAADEGRLQLIELGVGLEAESLWFCLNPQARASDPAFAFVQRAEFRQALSHAIDREAFARQAFQDAAVPIWGPVTPGNVEWFWPDVVRYRPDVARARELLAGIGLEDRNGNGVLEDPKGTEARLTVLVERGTDGHEHRLGLLRDALAPVGVAIQAEPVNASDLASRIGACDVQAVYHRSPVASLDPAMDLDFWLSTGARHVWNPRQRAPGTEWERRIDTVILEQAASTDAGRRKDQFILVQRTLAEQLPMLHFAAPRLYYAHSVRVRGVAPSVVRPYALWNADLLYAAR